jgi:two-component system CheB/CheR fusion protein
VESDVGRPLSHVRTRFAWDGLQADAEQVLRKLGTIERPIDETEDGSRYIMRILPYRTVENVIAGVVITFVDVTQNRLAEERIGALSQSLRNRVESLETLLELVPVGIMIDEDGEVGIARVNRYGAQLLGRDQGEDKLLSIPMELPLRKDGSAVASRGQPLQVAARTGQPAPAFEGRIEREDGTAIDVLISANPLFSEAGAVRGAIASMVDITFRKKAEARQEMLLHELQHRVKNILATVTALASRMADSAASLEQFSTAFIERLKAMARTHDVLSKNNWAGVELKTLAENALRSYADHKHDNISIDGPAVVLRPNVAATLGMVLFELATNAAKYGALASRNGKVELTWRVERASDPLLELRWKESGGGPVKPPAGDGFGTNFIKRSLSYEMGGTAEIGYARSGVECILRLPLKDDERAKEGA